jgi:GAF domain-containing protein
VSFVLFHDFAADEGGLHGAFAFPIILRGEVTGMMEFFSRGIHAPDDDLLLMLTALGTQIAKFIERERMAEQLAQYVENCPIAAQNGEWAAGHRNKLFALREPAL